MNDRQREDTVPPGWERPSPDAISRLGKRLRGRKTRRQFLRGAVAAAGVLATGGAFGLWLAAGRNREYDYGGMTCSQVVPLMSDYVRGTLPAPEQARVRDHLAQCPRCRKLAEKMTQPG